MEPVIGTLEDLRKTVLPTLRTEDAKFREKYLWPDKVFRVQNGEFVPVPTDLKKATAVRSAEESSSG